VYRAKGPGVYFETKNGPALGIASATRIIGGSSGTFGSGSTITFPAPTTGDATLRTVVPFAGTIEQEVTQGTNRWKRSSTGSGATEAWSRWISTFD
jgi:hypothetical protein